MLHSICYGQTAVSPIIAACLQTHLGRHKLHVSDSAVEVVVSARTGHHCGGHIGQLAVELASQMTHSLQSQCHKQSHGISKHTRLADAQPIATSCERAACCCAEMLLSGMQGLGKAKSQV